MCFWVVVVKVNLRGQIFFIAVRIFSLRRLRIL